MAILVASLLRRDEQRDNVYGLLLTFTFFVHMIPFLFSGLMICLYAFQRRRLRLLWQVVPGVLLSLGYLFGRFITAHNADADTGMFGVVRNYSAAFWAYKVNSYLKSFGFINPGTPSGSVSLRVLGPGAFLLMQLLNGILCTVFAWYLIRGALAAYREQKQERFLWSAGMIFVFFYMIAPATTLGISDPGSRLLQTALAVLLFLCGEDQTGSRMAMRLAAGCAVTLQVAALVLFVKVVLAPVQETASIPGLPRRVIVFAHVPNHAEDYV